MAAKVQDNGAEEDCQLGGVPGRPIWGSTRMTNYFIFVMNYLRYYTRGRGNETQCSK
jgi:hypothetical protein